MTILFQSHKEETQIIWGKWDLRNTETWMKMKRSDFQNRVHIFSRISRTIDVATAHNFQIIFSQKMRYQKPSWSQEYQECIRQWWHNLGWVLSKNNSFSRRNGYDEADLPAQFGFYLPFVVNPHAICLTTFSIYFWLVHLPKHRGATQMTYIHLFYFVKHSS